MLRSSESGGCLVEPQSPLCTCGVSPVSPASSPHVSSSSAPQSSPTRGGPARFSLSCERCTVLASSCQLGGKPCPSCMVLCGPPLVLVVHFPPCLPALVRVIIITIVVSALLLTSGPAYTTATCAGAAAISCTACGLLAHFGSVCQLQTLAIRGVFVPVDFGHWDLLSMLLLEVGDKFSHLVGTPTSLCESFLQSSRQTMVNEKGGKGFSSSDVGWARWQGEVNLLLHAFWCLRSLRRLWGILIWSLIRGVFQHYLPVRSFPWRRVLLWVGLSSSSSPLLTVFLSCLFLQFALYVPCSKETSTSRLYGKRSVSEQGAPQFYMRQPIT